MNSNRANFTRNSKPTISISDDNTIIRGINDTSANGEISTPRSNVEIQDRVSNVSFDWNPNESFHLGIEPWITSPVQSDISDGFFTGTVHGDTVETPKKSFKLAIKINTNYPESVVCLIKNRKAYIFKQSQIVALNGSKNFSDVEDPIAKVVKTGDSEWGIQCTTTGNIDPVKFKTKEAAEKSLKNTISGKIDSEKQFRIYAHRVMKKAHGDNYSEEKTNKVIQDLIDDHEDEDWGALVGRLTSGFGQKSFADPNQDPNQQMPPQQPQGQDQNQNQQNPPQQQDPNFNGNNPGQVQDANQQMDQNNQDNPDQYSMEPNKPMQPNEGSEINYTFDVNPVAKAMNLETLIGTLVMSSSYIHLYHLTTTNYPTHVALQEFYQKMPKLVDKLAEVTLADRVSISFKVCVIPQTKDADGYLMELRDYITEFQKLKLGDSPMTSSIVDEIITLISITLYKVRRLTEGKKVFSFSSESLGSTRIFSDNPPSKIDKEIWTSVKNIMGDIAVNIAKKTRRSPFKKVKSTDEKSIRKYVNESVSDGKTLNDVARAISDSVVDTLSRATMRS